MWHDTLCRFHSVQLYLQQLGCTKPETLTAKPNTDVVMSRTHYRFVFKCICIWIMHMHLNNAFLLVSFRICTYMYLNGRHLHLNTNLCICTCFWIFLHIQNLNALARTWTQHWTVTLHRYLTQREVIYHWGARMLDWGRGCSLRTWGGLKILLKTWGGFKNIMGKMAHKCT